MFELTDRTKVGMSFFISVLKATKPSAKVVNAENNKLLQSTVRPICEKTGHALYKNQIGTYYPFGGRKVRLGANDMKQIKNVGPSGMRLMGFKPMSELKVYHNIKHSYFIYPDEKKATGSSACADALIKEMLD